MIDDTLLDAEDHMSRSVDHVREDLTTIRTGRANPAMFNGVFAEYYGMRTPITQMATISVPEPRMLIIKPYEMSVMQEIENAIRNSDLGVNPTNDGQVLAGLVFAVGFVHWLAYQAVYDIDALCPYCMVVWAVVLPLFLITLVHIVWERQRDAAGIHGADRYSFAGSWIMPTVVQVVWYAAFVVLILVQFA